MAADESLLYSALEGTASLRFYGWSPATLSIGYFQPESLRGVDPLLAALPFVRRPSGGDTLVHHHEVTYMLALPSGAPWQTGGASWLRRMHAIIAAASRTLRVSPRTYAPGGSGPRPGPLCFHHFTAGDLLVGDAKIVGSAQRRRRGALLQHGAILLARSPHTPTLPGIHELTGHTLAAEEIATAICHEFVRQTNWQLVVDGWTECERERTRELASSKYTQVAWNRKR
jgi:lipoate-protein ligase A